MMSVQMAASTEVVSIRIDESAIFWLVSGIILSTFVALAANSIKDYITRPKLNIVSDETTLRRDNEIRILEVENNGMRVAKNCTATITIHNLNQGVVRPGSAGQYSSPLKNHLVNQKAKSRICWMSGDNTSIQPVNRSESMLLLICIYHNSSRIIIPSDIDEYQPSYILSDGCYDADVLVASENRSTKEKLQL
jgi:hypothetical protein